jgi:hypothetical protein
VNENCLDDQEFAADMAEIRAMAGTILDAVEYLHGADREHVLGNLAVVEKLYEMEPAVIE